MSRSETRQPPSLPERLRTGPGLLALGARAKESRVRCRPALLLLVLLACAAAGAEVSARQRGAPELLTYDELIRLSEQEEVPEALRAKVERLRATPFVGNDAAAGVARPRKPREAKLGRVVRVVSWNIERGLEYEAVEAALGGPAHFAALLDKSAYPRGGRKREHILRQAALLREADVIVLNEVDWGLKRTGYRNVAAELAAATGMNYAYGVEFIEVDPVALGTEQFEGLEPAERAQLVAQIKVDPARYKGLHGTAILSRFPLENVRLVPFRHQPYDWYAGEKKGVRPLEWGKRKASEVAFLEKVTRQIRRGGRMMLVADAVDAEIPGGRMTVVATHLEARAKPDGREEQLEELLAHVKEISHPVVVAGDMNTSTRDTTPTSIQREIKKRLGSKKFWIEKGLGWLTGIELPRSILLRGYNEYRKQADPTVRHVPFVAPNPEAEFFDELKDFRFADGGAFDFRGERRRSVGGKTDPLANSNQRGGKGFITTYEVERTIGFVGRFKLDWIFVKPPGLTEPYAEDAPHRFSPHFGRTLKSLNDSIEDRISDHSPLVVDLPLDEPPISSQPRGARARRSPSKR